MWSIFRGAFPIEISIRKASLEALLIPLPGVADFSASVEVEELMRIPVNAARQGEIISAPVCNWTCMIVSPIVSRALPSV